MIVYESDKVVIDDMSVGRCPIHEARLKDSAGFCTGHPVKVCGTAQEAYDNLRDCYKNYIDIPKEVVNG